MSLMFEIDGSKMPTCNPLGGRCPYECSYCYSFGDGGLVQKYNMAKYHGPIRIIDKELKRKFKQNVCYFIQDMSDLFAYNVPSQFILTVLRVLKTNPKTDFLLLTKNPCRYEEFIEKIPKNCILGATIETNREISKKISKAPDTCERAQYMYHLTKNEAFDHRTMYAVEPAMALDPETLAKWLQDTSPDFIYYGLDNHNNGLPEPSLEESSELLELLSKFTEVRVKTLRDRKGG